MAQDAANKRLHRLSLLGTEKVFEPLGDGSNEELVGSPSLSLFRLLGRWQGRRIFYAALRYSGRWLQGHGHILTGRTVFSTRLQRGNHFAMDYSRFSFCLR